MEFLSNRRTWLLFLVLIYIFVHMASFTSIYAARNDDVANVIPVINHLGSPSLYPDNDVAQYLLTVQKQTAPLYYYVIAFPLSLLLHPGHVLTFLGIVFAALLALFSGGSWSTPEDNLRCLLVIGVFLHLSMQMNPLMGIMRSFAIVGIAGLFWAEETDRSIGIVVLIGFTTGIYPPAGLLLLTYVFIKSFSGLERNRIWYFCLCLIAFLLALAPYLHNLIVPSHSLATNWVPPIQYDLGSLSGILQTFVFGWGRGALFMTPSPRSVFLVFVILCGLQWLILGNRRFQIRTPVVYLLASSMLLWLLAHLLHPHLYQPNRYTMATLPFLGCVLFVDNLVPFMQQLTKRFSKYGTIRVLLLILTLIPAFLYWERVLERPSNIINEFHFLYGIYMGKVWEGFTFGFPLLLILSASSIKGVKRGILKTIFILFLLIAFLFYPHCITTCGHYGEHGQPISYYHNLYKTLRDLPRDILVAGPPSLMDPVMAYGRRNVFFRHEQNDIKFVCQRMEEFARVYFARSRQTVRAYLTQNNIDYLLIDRENFRDRSLNQCRGSITKPPQPILDRDFRSATWSRDSRFYLLSRQQILRQLEENPGKERS